MLLQWPQGSDTGSAQATCSAIIPCVLHFECTVCVLQPLLLSGRLSEDAERHLRQQCSLADTYKGGFWLTKELPVTYEG